jgi:hypothetical protein
MSKRNAEALNRLANYIAHHPERYDQTQWGWKTDPTADKTASVSVRECGSNQCLAGHAARQSGWTPYVTPIASGGIFVDWEKVRKPGQRVFREVSSVARKELGLTPRESAILFAGGWAPANGQTVQWALRQLAKGASIEDVSASDAVEWSADDVVPFSATARYNDALEVLV